MKQVLKAFTLLQDYCCCRVTKDYAF